VRRLEVEDDGLGVRGLQDAARQVLALVRTVRQQLAVVGAGGVGQPLLEVGRALVDEGREEPLEGLAEVRGRDRRAVGELDAVLERVLPGLAAVRRGAGVGGEVADDLVLGAVVARGLVSGETTVDQRGEGASSET